MFSSLGYRPESLNNLYHMYREPVVKQSVAKQPVAVKQPVIKEAVAPVIREAVAPVTKVKTVVRKAVVKEPVVEAEPLEEQESSDEPETPVIEKPKSTRLRVIHNILRKDKVEPTKPVEQAKPQEVLTILEEPKPVEEIKPVEPPAEAPKPAKPKRVTAMSSLWKEAQAHKIPGYNKMKKPDLLAALEKFKRT